MARQTIVSTQQAERITDRALRHIRPIFGKCYGYPIIDAHIWHAPLSIITWQSHSACKFAIIPCMFHLLLDRDAPLSRIYYLRT
ncbi:hypothetical protein [Rhodococcus sp. GA1]|uniref:hypothetical protein n=1 Tax=unclassified Rhodococcus (in: high G+C Gram-positive bacteria) TaxID=192944 RepID=UPI0020CBA120|nr:hypothetical protein [Rhodococcus sp. GA1]